MSDPGISAETLKKYPVLQKLIDSEDFSEIGGGREEALVKHVKSALHDRPGTPAQVLAAIDDFANNVDFLINIGWHKGALVTDVIAQEKPRILVECGGYVGYSAILFADAMRKAVAPGQAVKLWSLEFEEQYAKVARELIQLAGLDDLVNVVVGPGAQSLRNLKADGKIDHIDMLFLDHVEELYEPDLKVAEELGLLKAGACIVADNVVRPGAPEYRKYVRSHAGLKSWGVKGLIIPGEFDDELEISKVL